MARVAAVVPVIRAERGAPMVLRIAKKGVRPDPFWSCSAYRKIAAQGNADAQAKGILHGDDDAQATTTQALLAHLAARPPPLT